MFIISDLWLGPQTFYLVVPVTDIGLKLYAIFFQDWSFANNHPNSHEFVFLPMKESVSLIQFSNRDIEINLISDDILLYKCSSIL